MKNKFFHHLLFVSLGAVCSAMGLTAPADLQGAQNSYPAIFGLSDTFVSTEQALVSNTLASALQDALTSLVNKIPLLRTLVADCLALIKFVPIPATAMQGVVPVPVSAAPLFSVAAAGVCPSVIPDGMQWNGVTNELEKIPG